jgi:hypothetical protein
LDIHTPKLVFSGKIYGTSLGQHLSPIFNVFPRGPIGFRFALQKKNGQAEPRCLLQIGLQMIPEAVVKAYSRHWNPKKRSENCEAAME